MGIVWRVFYHDLTRTRRSYDCRAQTWEEAIYCVSRKTPVELFGAGGTPAQRTGTEFTGAAAFEELTGPFLGKMYDETAFRVVTLADEAPASAYPQTVIVTETIMGQEIRRVVSGLNSDHRRYPNSHERAKAGLDQGAHSGSDTSTYPHDIPHLVMRLASRGLMQALDDNDPITTWPSSTNGTGLSGAALGTPRLQLGGRSGAAINDCTVVNMNDSPAGGFALSTATLDFTLGITFLMVIKPVAAASPAWGTLLQLGTDNTGDLRFGRDGSTDALRLRTASGSYISGAGVFVANTPMAIGFTIASGAVGTAQIAQFVKAGINLGAAGSGTVLPVKSYTSSVVSWKFGTENMSALKASVAEIVLYNRRLASTELARIQAFWAVRFGV